MTIHESFYSSLLIMTTGERRELRLLRKLGTRRFRSVLLALEKCNHASDGERNINYHPASTDEAAVQRYMGYLLYHTVLHGSAVLFGIVYIAFLLCLSGAIRWFLVPTGVLCVLNLYCILLQREEYLLIKEYRFRYGQRLKRRAWHLAVRIKVNTTEADDVCLTTGMLEALEKGGDFFLQDKDIPSLRRMAALVSGLTLHAEEKTTDVAVSEDPVDFCRRKRALYDKKEIRAAFLQKYFTVPGSRNVLELPVWVTESEACEEAFRAVFPYDSRQLYLEILTALCILYAETGCPNGRVWEEEPCGEEIRTF